MRNVLVTGAAGSIGVALVDELSKNNEFNLILLDRNENSLYFLQERYVRNNKMLSFVLGDILDKDKLLYVFESFEIDFVIHCAAYKHVPLMESNVYEVVRNNVEGLLNVVNCSKIYKIKKFLFISTDKAVYPSSVMGLSKRLGELIIHKNNIDLNEIKFMSLRLTNLLNSNGSVLPLFEKQYELHKEIYITSDLSKRFFLSNSQLSTIILKALEYKGNSSMLMGSYENEKYIRDLAFSFLKEKGCEKMEDHIKYIGLRRGEKLKEELFYKHENVIKLNNKILKEVDMNISINNDFYKEVTNLVKRNKANLENESKQTLSNLVNCYAH